MTATATYLRREVLNRHEVAAYEQQTRSIEIAMNHDAYVLRSTADTKAILNRYAVTANKEGWLMTSRETSWRTVQVYRRIDTNRVAFGCAEMNHGDLIWSGQQFEDAVHEWLKSGKAA
jgi:hypothetical protein